MKENHRCFPVYGFQKPMMRVMMYRCRVMMIVLWKDSVNQMGMYCLNRVVNRRCCRGAPDLPTALNHLIRCPTARRSVAS